MSTPYRYRSHYTMNLLLPQFDPQPCTCGHGHLIHRRDFLLSLLLGPSSFPLLLTTQPARAEQHKAKALVLSCIDFRFLEFERYFLSLQHLGNQYDWTALAGASLALTGFPHKAEAEAFWDQLALSRQFHQIEKVIILDHQDCGAYASKIDSELSLDREREQQVHADYLTRAYWEIQKRYAELTVELYFVTLDSEVRPVLPNSKSVS